MKERIVKTVKARQVSKTSMLITIPVDVRDALGIEDKDILILRVEDGKLIIVPAKEV